MGGREFTVYVDNPDGSGQVAIGPDDEIPSWARKVIDKRHLKKSRADDGDDGDDGDEPFEPADHTVEEVNEYLSGEDVTEDETARVLAAETDGKARAGIVSGPHAAG